MQESAEFISDRIGLGLSSSSELLTYPVIFTPLAYVWDRLKNANLSVADQAAAKNKLIRWFVGSVLSRRYQQSTHDKQSRDKNDIWRWIEDGDSEQPNWLTETYITNIRTADPDGAIGKLFRTMLNNKSPKDPIKGTRVGVGVGTYPSAKHHIFPTRWVHHLEGWDRTNDTANLALNIMYVEEETNGSWLNCDPRDQILNSIDVLGSEEQSREIYLAQGITTTAYNILLKPSKTKQDFMDFIAERESWFAGQLEHYGFKRPILQTEAEDMDDDDV